MNFHEELRLFRERTTDAERFRALIILGSGQETTAALLMGTLQLERVAFLLTKNTRDFPQRVAKVLEGCSNLPPLATQPEQWLCPEGDHSAPLQVYEGVKQVFEEWDDAGIEPSSIAVDVTGGMKPMSVGLEKAAHLLGLTTIYLESEYGPGPTPGTRRPISGTQRLVIPPDPYQVFGDLEAAEAKRLYAAHDYVSAQRIFSNLVKRQDGNQFRRFVELARAYAAWDAFDIQESMRTLNGIVQPHAWAYDHMGLRSQEAALTRLLEVTRHADGRGVDALETLADHENVLPLLGSLYANAIRREEQKRYDVATLLIYRCLELISQHRLATWGILSEQPDFELARSRVPDLEHRYRNVQTAQRRAQTYPLPDRSFGLFVGYMLLVALRDPLVRNYDISQIERRTKARNKSLLAHGYKLIDQQNYRNFHEILDCMLTKLFTILDQDRSRWEQTYRFVRLNEL